MTSVQALRASSAGHSFVHNLRRGLARLLLCSVTVTLIRNKARLDYPHGRFYNLATKMEKFNVPLLPSNPSESDWTYFIRQFNNYLLIVSATDEQNLPLFMNSLGRDGIDIFDGLPEPKDTYENAVLRFETHFTGRTSVLLLRKQFYEARQQCNESASDFACRLRRISNECQFGTNKDTMLRDIFVVGIRNDILGEKLLAEDSSTLTFDNALARAEAFERARSERGAVSTCAKTVNATQRQGKKPFARTGNVSRNQPVMKPAVVDRLSGEAKRTCFRCGSTDHLANSPRCKGKNSICHNCGLRGHFSVVCKTRVSGSKPNVNVSRNFSPNHDVNVHVSRNCPPNHDVNAIGNDSELEYNVFGTAVKEGLHCMSRLVAINGAPVESLIDTGSEVNVISRSHTCNAPLSQTSAKILACGIFPLPVIGQANLNISYRGKSTVATFYVIDDNSNVARPLLSYSLCLRLGMMQELVPDKVPLSNVCSVEADYADVFEGIGSLCSGYQYKLSVDQDIPQYSPPARRLPAAVIPKLQDELKRLTEAEIIEPVTDPTDICSPSVVVYKKSGDVRLVADMRHLNKYVRREEYQIPTVDELAAQVESSKFFSKLDFRAGFHQIPVHPESRKYLCFSTPAGRFSYKKLPMGLVSAPEVFTRVLREVLSGISGVLIFFDDVLVHSKTEKEHQNILRDIFERIRKNGLKLNRDKCTFLAKEVEFLGHLWSEAGISLDPQKVAAITSMPKPTDKQSLRSFLGLAGYMGQRALPHYSSLVQPLWEMLKAEQFCWSSQASEAFLKLRELLAGDNCRAFFDPSRRTVIQTDASGQGIGAVILQDRKPVVFASRLLTDTEKRYSQLEREFLAIVFGLTKLKHYLIGMKFELETDSKPITQLFDKPIDSLSNRLQRWLIAIQHFEMNIVHINGSDNLLADALSRNSIPGNPTETEISEHTLCFTLKSLPVDLKTVAEATAADEILCEVVNQVQHNWKSSTPALRTYFQMRHELCVKHCKGLFLLCKGSQVVIPESLRRSILDIAHEAHAGMVKMKSKLRSYCFWPRMHADIENYVRSCSSCTMYQVRGDPPPLSPIAEKEEKPWNSIAVDLTGPNSVLDGKVLLTVIDLYSRFPEVFVLKRGSSEEIISCLRTLFARYGFCKYLKSDNGSVFVSEEFKQFLSICGVKHLLSPLYYPQGNGCIERFHSTLKSRLKRIRDRNLSLPFQQVLDNVLFDVRSSANDVTGETPFYRMFGREMSTKLSYLSVDGECYVKSRSRDVRAEYSRRRAVVKNFRPGEMVMVRKVCREPFKFKAKIIRKIGAYSYEVDMDGRSCVYNQSNLKRLLDADFDEDARAEEAYEDAVARSLGDVDKREREQASVGPSSERVPEVLEVPEVSVPLRRSTRIRKQPQRFGFS